MFAKRLFYAAASLMCLVLTFHFGASSARSQAAGVTMMAADLEDHGGALVASNGDVYFGLYPSSGNGAHWSLQGNIGNSSPIVALSTPDGNTIQALAADGSFYVSPDLGHTWELKANAFGGPVPTQMQTWGALKARYR